MVDRGELEKWLSDLGIEGHGSSWLIAMFERMRSDPQAVDYVRPGASDVWGFLGAVRAWTGSPERRGIPSEQIPDLVAGAASEAVATEEPAAP